MRGKPSSWISRPDECCHSRLGSPSLLYILPCCEQLFRHERGNTRTTYTQFSSNCTGEHQILRQDFCFSLMVNMAEFWEDLVVSVAEANKECYDLLGVITLQMVTFPNFPNSICQFQCLIAVVCALLFTEAEFCIYQYARGSFKIRSTVLLDVKFGVARGCLEKNRFW